MKNDYLIVIDMQNDFLTGALGTAEGASIIDAVAQKAATFDGTVYFTRDTHTADYLSTQEGKNLPVPHCRKGSEGWQLAPALEQVRQTRQGQVFDKPAFGSPQLAETLQQAHQQTPITSITFVGVCTDICVLSNVLLCKAFLPEVPIRVEASLCAGVTPLRHETALSAMEACQVEILP